MERMPLYLVQHESDWGELHYLIEAKRTRPAYEHCAGARGVCEVKHEALIEHIVEGLEADRDFTSRIEVWMFLY